MTVIKTSLKQTGTSDTLHHWDSILSGFVLMQIGKLRRALSQSNDFLRRSVNFLKDVSFLYSHSILCPVCVIQPTRISWSYSEGQVNVSRRCMAPSKREPCKYKLTSSLTIGVGRDILPSQLERTWLAHAETYSIVFLSSSFCLPESVSEYPESDFQGALEDGVFLQSNCFGPRNLPPAQKWSP
jgi:hypothetical protein